jgi:hypothetical protein
MITHNFSKTGDKCPISGEWFTLEDNVSSVYLNQGEEMPPFNGRSVSWQLKKGK